MNYKSVIPIIPSLNPDNKLIDLVNDLLENEFNKIIVVDDGSKDKDIFNTLCKNNHVILLTHDVNKGKGEAIKTALTYYKDNLIKDYSGIITMDADGQHLVVDAINVSNEIVNSNKFTIGTRLFNTKETPLRNKMGNRITSKMFKRLFKVYLKDTQTGLRGVPNRLIDLHLNTNGSRYEYEMNTLIDLVKSSEEIREVDIKTVYLENSNKKSHFKPIKDSYRIYKLMFKRKKDD